jgi:hypothetical protein
VDITGDVIVTNHDVLGKIKRLICGTKESTVDRI